MNPITLSIYLIWFISEILVNRLTRSKNQSNNGNDKNSLALIWLTVVLAVTASVVIAMNFSYPISSSTSILYVGLSVILFGVILRFTIIRSLGIFFTADVTIRENHALKTNGFYKFIRHPSYFASLLSFAGFGLSLNNWVSFLLVTFSIFAAFIYRIKVEEIALINHFGPQYLDYKKSTKGLIPFIF